MSKFIVYCSCLVCKKQTTVQSLKAHLLKHDKESIPKANCLSCSAPIFEGRKKFCNHKCAATVTNVTRGYVRTGPPPGYRAGIPNGRAGIPNGRAGIPHARKRIAKICPVAACKVCGKFFHNPRHNKLCCSKACRMEIIKHNRGRGKKSYMESSFATWLDRLGVYYETEVSFTNDVTKKWYFVDFLFRDKKLIIELDGTQHLFTAESDALRDEYFTSIGYTVVRVSHADYQKRTRVMEIKELLNIF